MNFNAKGPLGVPRYSSSSLTRDEVDDTITSAINSGNIEVSQS